MTMPVIMDVAVVVVLAGLTLWGARRGLVKSLAGLLVIIVALVGAGMAASALADPVTNLIVPGIEERFTARLEELLGEELAIHAEELTPDSAVLAEVMEQLGLDEDFREELLEKVESIMVETGAPLVTAAIEAVVRGVVYGVLYILAFLLLLILLHLLAAAMNLVMKLPVLNGVNRLGGALIGFLQGVLVLFLAVWIARVMGVSFETGELADTRLLRFFANNNFLSLLSFLQ